MAIEQAQRDVEAKEQALADAKAVLERVKAQEPRYYRYGADHAIYQVAGDLIAKVDPEWGVSITVVERKNVPSDFFAKEAIQIPASDFHAAARAALAKITEALALPDEREPVEELADEYASRWIEMGGTLREIFAEAITRERAGR